jgi:hypothetical protein
MRILWVIVLLGINFMASAQTEKDLRTYVDYFPNHEIRIKSTGFIVSNALLEK